jgi:pyocin large subunit-like protein
VKQLVMAAAAALLLTSCGPQAAEPEAEAKAPAAENASSNAAAEAETPTVDGKPIWSSNRELSAQENAQKAFDRNGETFGAKDLDAFVQKAHDFTSNPPKGAETLKRANGDTLIYDPKSNTFAVVTKDGAPRTMFKPDEGEAYWAEQKSREAARGAKAEG